MSQRMQNNPRISSTLNLAQGAIEDSTDSFLNGLDISRISNSNISTVARRVRASRPKRVPVRVPRSKAAIEIKRYQKSVDFLIPRESFKRLCREILQFACPSYRYQPVAFDALQLAAEDYIVELMKYSNVCAIHAKRVTIMPKDLKLANELLSVHRRPLKDQN